MLQSLKIAEQTNVKFGVRLQVDKDNGQFNIDQVVDITRPSFSSQTFEISQKRLDFNHFGIQVHAERTSVVKFWYGY